MLAEATSQSLLCAEPGAMHFAFSSSLRLTRVLGIDFGAKPCLLSSWCISGFRDNAQTTNANVAPTGNPTFSRF